MVWPTHLADSTAVDRSQPVGSGLAGIGARAAAVRQPPSVINPSLFRHVVIELPEEGASFLPSLANGG